MTEKPTLTKIKEIAADDDEFEKKLLSIIKKELPQEIKLYNENCRLEDYKKVAENVHKLTHKINIFGLENAHQTAVAFENRLREGNCDLKCEFDEILEKMTKFINSI